MVNAHKRNKEYYGGEVMPEGTADCNSCGWHSTKNNFKYGLCNSCGEPEWWEDGYGTPEYVRPQHYIDDEIY